MLASIVIPYYQRREHLKEVLKGLSVQSLDFDKYEIIVVDDGSKHTVDDFAGSISTLIKTKHRGAAAARNTGISVAKGDIVIFLDSDIIVDFRFVETHCDFHKDNNKDNNIVALGPRLHKSPIGDEVQIMDTRLKLLKRYGKTVSELNHPWFMTYTCNVSVTKEQAMSELFDERYREWGLEDSEWAYRLYRKGYDFTFLNEATGIHLYHDRTMTDKKFQKWNKNLAYTISKHPELKILECFRGVFDPKQNNDYFETYDKFEEIACVTIY